MNQSQRPDQVDNTLIQPRGLLRSSYQFSDGLFSCGDGVGCLMSYFLTPLRMAITHSRAGTDTYQRTLLIYGLPWLCVFIFSFASGASPIIGYLALLSSILVVAIGSNYRAKLRSMYRLHGDGCTDCLVHCLCSCCAVAQEGRHVDRDTGYLPIPPELAAVRVVGAYGNQIVGNASASPPRQNVPSYPQSSVIYPQQQQMQQQMAPMPMQPMHYGQPMSLYQPQPTYQAQMLAQPQPVYLAHPLQPDAEVVPQQPPARSSYI